MKLRAIANGNVIERDDDEAQALLATGIYEKIEEGEATPPAKPQNKAATNYKRRDMRADK